MLTLLPAVFNTAALRSVSKVLCNTLCSDQLASKLLLCNWQAISQPRGPPPPAQPATMDRPASSASSAGPACTATSVNLQPSAVGFNNTLRLPSGSQMCRLWNRMLLLRKCKCANLMCLAACHQQDGWTTVAKKGKASGGMQSAGSASPSPWSPLAAAGSASSFSEDNGAPAAFNLPAPAAQQVNSTIHQATHKDISRDVKYYGCAAVSRACGLIRLWLTVCVRPRARCHDDDASNMPQFAMPAAGTSHQRVLPSGGGCSSCSSNGAPPQPAPRTRGCACAFDQAGACPCGACASRRTGAAGRTASQQQLPECTGAVSSRVAVSDASTCFNGGVHIDDHAGLMSGCTGCRAPPTQVTIPETTRATTLAATMVSPAIQHMSNLPIVKLLTLKFMQLSSVMLACGCCHSQTADSQRQHC